MRALALLLLFSLPAQAASTVAGSVARQAVPAHLDPLARGSRSYARGEWEQAADLLAEALFADPQSPEARRMLRLAAQRVLEDRAAAVQRERLVILCGLGLAPEEDCRRPLEPEAERPVIRIGPPTPEGGAAAPKPRARAKRKGGDQPSPPPEKPPPSPADREMAKIFYYQGLKAYADNELAEARAAWRKALELDPQMERAQKALDRLDRMKR